MNALGGRISMILVFFVLFFALSSAKFCLQEEYPLAIQLSGRCGNFSLGIPENKNIPTRTQCGWIIDTGITSNAFVQIDCKIPSTDRNIKSSIYFTHHINDIDIYGMDKTSNIGGFFPQKITASSEHHIITTPLLPTGKFYAFYSGEDGLHSFDTEDFTCSWRVRDSDAPSSENECENTYIGSSKPTLKAPPSTCTDSCSVNNCCECGTSASVCTKCNDGYTLESDILGTTTCAEKKIEAYYWCFEDTFQYDNSFTINPQNMYALHLPHAIVTQKNLEQDVWCKYNDHKGDVTKVGHFASKMFAHLNIKSGDEGIYSFKNLEENVLFVLDGKTTLLNQYQENAKYLSPGVHPIEIWYYGQSIWQWKFGFNMKPPGGSFRDLTPDDFVAMGSRTIPDSCLGLNAYGGCSLCDTSLNFISNYFMLNLGKVQSYLNDPIIDTIQSDHKLFYNFATKKTMCQDQCDSLLGDTNTVTAPSGIITDGNMPRRSVGSNYNGHGYPYLCNCGWKIQTESSSEIELFLEKFDFHPADQLIVYDGADDTATVLFELTGKDFITYKNTIENRLHVLGHKYTSTTNQVFIKMICDKYPFGFTNNYFSGFLIKYKTLVAGTNGKKDSETGGFVSCDSGYYLSGIAGLSTTTCLEKSTTCTVANCKECDSQTDYCLECDATYQLVDGLPGSSTAKCVKDPSCSTQYKHDSVAYSWDDITFTGSNIKSSEFVSEQTIFTFTPFKLCGENVKYIKIHEEGSIRLYNENGIVGSIFSLGSSSFQTMNAGDNERPVYLKSTTKTNQIYTDINEFRTIIQWNNIDLVTDGAIVQIILYRDNTFKIQYKKTITQTYVDSNFNFKTSAIEGGVMCHVGNHFNFQTNEQYYGVPVPVGNQFTSPVAFSFPSTDYMDICFQCNDPDNCKTCVFTSKNTATNPIQYWNYNLGECTSCFGDRMLNSTFGDKFCSPCPTEKNCNTCTDAGVCDSCSGERFLSSGYCVICDSSCPTEQCSVSNGYCSHCINSGDDKFDNLGNCESLHGGKGCSNSICSALVCKEMSSCCDSNWSSSCVSKVDTLCRKQTKYLVGTAEVDGVCNSCTNTSKNCEYCAHNGGCLSCNENTHYLSGEAGDANTVCTPYTCDSSCEHQAKCNVTTGFCHFCSGSGSTFEDATFLTQGSNCLLEHTGSGDCDDTLCTSIVTAIHSGCSSSWTSTCVSLATKLCEKQTKYLDGVYGIDAVCKSCTDITKNCTVCSNIGGCLECANGFILSGTAGESTTVCKPCVDGGNCVTCNSNDYHCTSCSDGYAPTSTFGSNDTMCSPCPVGKNCKTCDLDTGECLTCDLYYDGSPCVQCGDECKTCNTSISAVDGGCKTCSDYHYLTGDAGKFGTHCKDCRDVCKTCGTNGGCTTCVDGFTLIGDVGDADARCFNCTDANNCKTCNTETLFCTSCLTGFFNASLVTDSFDVVCKQCNEAPFNCKTCDGNGICTSCDDDHYYEASPNHCGKCSRSESNCKSCDKDGNCLTCHSGYDLFNDPELSLTTCIQCPSGSLCKTCNTTMTQNFTSWNDFPLYGGCKTCLDTEHFLNAEPGKIAIPGFPGVKCVPCTDWMNCKTCNENTGVCLDCNTGYTLFNGICNKNADTTLAVVSSNCNPEAFGDLCTRPTVCLAFGSILVGSIFNFKKSIIITIIK